MGVTIDVDREFQQAEAHFRAAVRDPEAAQEELLADILRRNRDTAYGREHGFASIGDLREYRRRVPLVSYADLAPYVDRMVAGEADILFEGRATFFGHTSGTTSRPKRIGFNPRVRNEYLHMLGPIVACLERDFPGASRTVLLLTAQFDEERSPTGVPIGNASGFVRRALGEHPYFRGAPESVYECSDFDARDYAFLLFALTRPIRCFASLFPAQLLTLFRRASEFAEPLAEDLERGTLQAGPPGIAALLPECAPRLRPMPEAARRLREIVRAHGRFAPGEYWTDVAAFHVWKGGTAKHSLPELQSLFPRAEIRPMSSGSTEASLMVPLEGSWMGGLPALRSTVMDFLPADAALDPAEVVTLRDLQEDRAYRLVVTNHRGLYRYVMEDAFVLEGTYQGVPYLRLSHRIGAGVTSSLTGEKLTEEHVSRAIDEAIEASGLVPRVFQVAPEKLAGDASVYRYVVQMETAGSPDRALLLGFVRAFEDALWRLDQSYSLSRRWGTLRPAALWRVRPGTFDERIRERARARGLNDVQVKLLALDKELVSPDDGAVIEIVSLE